MTNQSQWSKKPDEPKGKIESILTAIETVCGWRPWCFIATHPKDTVYRKPARGMYDGLLTALGQTADAVTHLQMCGDAVGDDDPYLPYRWSDSDKKFAETIGATFKRPMDVLGKYPVVVPKRTQEIVLLMGNPGSGKSTTGRRFAEAGYVHIEQDVVGTKAKTLKAVKDVLPSGRSVVIDATHGSYSNREVYDKLGKEKNIALRIVWHVNDGRVWNSERSSPVPEVAYAMYSKHFVDPRGDGVEVEIVN
jgi:bifunctional polynucleotide phosphatase/kinase